MNLSNLQDLKKLLQKYNVCPNRILGQNFLIDEESLAKIVAAANITKDDLILEVGPGAGVLTRELASRAKKVVAVEKDGQMTAVLIDVLAGYPNVQVINEDILKYLECFEEEKYKVVANIPYYLTSQLIRQLLEKENQPEEIVLLVQKEVAERICANQGKMSILSISVQIYGDPEIIAIVEKDKFWPAPEVDSAILKISNIRKDSIDTEKEHFFEIIKAGFSAKRKTLANNLSKKLQLEKSQVEKILQKIGIDPKQRAESLSIEDWKNLAKEIKQYKDNGHPEQQ